MFSRGLFHALEKQRITGGFMPSFRQPIQSLKMPGPSSNFLWQVAAPKMLLADQESMSTSCSSPTFHIFDTSPPGPQPFPECPLVFTLDLSAAALYQLSVPFLLSKLMQWLKGDLQGSKDLGHPI